MTAVGLWRCRDCDTNNNGAWCTVCGRPRPVSRVRITLRRR
ncbi:hypothetical protein [Streptomyces fradiae]